MIDLENVSVEELFEEIELRVHDIVMNLVISLEEANIPQDVKDEAIEQMYAQAEAMISEIPTIVLKIRANA